MVLPPFPCTLVLSQNSILVSMLGAFSLFPGYSLLPRGKEPREEPLLWWVWHHPGKEAMGMLLPKVILKIKAAVKGSWGLPSAVQPHGVGLFSPPILLYPPANWGSPEPGDVEELEVEECAGWLWRKLWQLHPWIPLWTVPSARSIQKSHQKMMLWMRKIFEEAAGAQG